MRELITQLFRFGVVGVVSSLGHLVLYLAQVELLDVQPHYANGVAYVLMLSVTYLGNHKWTFEREGNHGFHLLRFIPVAMGGAAIGYGGTYVIVDMLAYPAIYSVPLMWLVLPIWNFIALKLFTFVDHPEEAA